MVVKSITLSGEVAAVTPTGPGQPRLSLTLLLGALAMLGPFATDTYLPSFPSIARDFGVGDLEVQQTLSVYLCGYALMSLFWGTLSDSLGRRPIVLIALSLFLAGSLGAAWSHGLPMLLGFRGMQGLSAGAGMVVGQAIVRDRLTGAAAQRLIAQIMMVFGLAPALAPIIGGWLQVSFGWRASFFFMALFTLLLLISCAWALPESLPAAHRQPLRVATVMGNYRTAILHPLFMLRCFAIGCVFSGLALYISSAADFVLRILKLPPTSFAWLFLPLIGGLVSGSSMSGRLAHRVSGSRLIAAGFSVMTVAVAANLAYTYWCIPAVPWAVLPVFGYTFGLALCVPSMSLATLDIFPQLRGMAASLQNCLQMSIFAFMSGVVAPALFGSAFKLACGVTVGLVLGAVSWRIAARRAEPSETHQSPAGAATIAAAGDQPE
jgi:DHA1 family bicyclomycin/chloramphenicol resistance-like MFS transporter